VSIDPNPRTATHPDRRSPRRARATAPARAARPAPPAPALLRITRGPQAGMLFALPTGITTVGRHTDCDIAIPDTTISRHHAAFHHLGDAINVIDLGSFNGTYVNRRIVDHAALADGDEIWIGKFRLILEWGSSPATRLQDHLQGGLGPLRRRPLGVQP
jgi:pSer/pThr/pTyr-binding forkhead associated (FHA) protein